MSVSYFPSPVPTKPATVPVDLLSVSQSKAQNAIEASIETAIPINVDPSVSVWVWESFVAVRRSDVEAQGSPIGCRTECGSTRGRTKETKSTPQTWPQKPTPAAQRSSMISSATGFSGTTIKRYSAGERSTPVETADRLHWLAMVVADLAGSYNDILSFP